MKFSSWIPFEKHLKATLDPIVIIVVPCEYERRKYIDQVKALISASVVSLNDDVSVEQIKHELLSPNLWSGRTLVIVDGADKIKNTVILADHALPQGSYLILAAPSFKSLSPLYQKGKKEIIVLDLSEEKPWEKERRLQQWLQGKTSKEVAVYLLQHLGADAATLEQELNKLLCYVGEKNQITLDDVKAICGSRDLVTGWQLAEKLIWEKPVSLGHKSNDLGFIFPFIGQLRYHLQLGCQLAELQPAEAKQQFPHLRQFDKFSQIAKARKASFFARGLQALYDLEFASKSSSLDLGAVFDHFSAKLYENPLSSS